MASAAVCAALTTFSPPGRLSAFSRSDDAAESIPRARASLLSSMAPAAFWPISVGARSWPARHHRRWGRQIRVSRCRCLLCSDGVSASASRYAHLQRREADSRVRELESALAQLQELERARAEAWREAAHDLRGRAHAIASASAVLTRDGVPEQHRTRFSEVLKLGVQSLNRLLGDLMDQARLEAGHERRQIRSFRCRGASERVLRYDSGPRRREGTVSGCEGQHPTHDRRRRCEDSAHRSEPRAQRDT